MKVRGRFDVQKASKPLITGPHSKKPISGQLGLPPWSTAVDFFGGSRDLIQQLGEGIGLPKFSSRFDAKMPWTKNVISPVP